MTAWWLCPNTPPCPHGAVLHDVEDFDDPTPRCCAEGCGCGKRPADSLAGDPVARRLGLVDADGQTLCRCLVGAQDCTHRPDGQTEDGAR